MSENENQTQGDPELGDAGKAALAAERKRANDAEKALRDAAAKLKQIEDADKTELEKAQNRIAELESSNAALTNESASKDLTILKLNTGIEEGLPKNLIARLQGTDEETFKADAASLRELVPADTSSPFPKADPSQGAKGSTGKSSNADTFASQMDAAGF